jgi:hypothetical protein
VTHGEDVEQITPAHTVAVTTVRVTWLDAAGTPDHPWAVTYRFTDPVVLTLGYRYSTPPLGTPALSQAFPLREHLAHLTAPYDHEQRMGVAYLAHSLQRPGTPKCVEAWAEMEDGLWAYVLFPWWNAHHILDDWPMKTEPGQELHAAGRLRQVGAHTWPPLCPLDTPHTVEPGVTTVIVSTSVPPPPHGFPATHFTARHARRPTPHQAT